jgi:prenyltransferase beta subunit
MLQVARLAPKQLGESRDLVSAFLRERVNPDGGFQDRAGASDLYYTVFGLDGLIALQDEVPAARTAAYLDGFGDGAGLDFVHVACLARSWAALRRPPDMVLVDRILARIEACRSDDGGYATMPSAPHGSAYGAFLAMGAYQDLGRPVPAAQGVVTSLGRLRAADGSYGNHPGLTSGVTTATAAAVLVLRHLDAPLDRAAGLWLLDRCHTRGGFFASCSTPVPDLLSTATALHALSALHLPIAGLRDPCLDFVDSLWTNRGGFFGTWADDAVDCEYTYYALLALGHLSLDPS